MLTKEFWEGEFGDEYTKRNRVDWIKRIPFWRDIAAKTGVKSVLEVGCNAGWNLSALRMVMPHNTMIGGVEINDYAAIQANNLGFPVYKRLGGIWVDMVFTAGVLIHVAPQDIESFMMDIIISSKRYVLAIEYFAEEEIEVEYRGHAGKLWKRNYGKLYEDMGLKCIDTGFLDKDSGFDNCTYWLMEKV